MLIFEPASQIEIILSRVQVPSDFNVDVDSFLLRVDARIVTLTLNMCVSSDRSTLHSARYLSEIYEDRSDK